MPPKRKKGTYKGKPRKQARLVKYACPNPFCTKVFDTQAGLSTHYLSRSTCFKTSFSDQNQSHHQTVRDIINQKDGTTPDEYEIPFFELDDSSSAHDSHLVEDSNPSVHPNYNPFEVQNDSNTDDNYSENNQIAYSTTDVAEIELLKLLNDANVPHFLYRQILEWGHKSNLSGYNFEPIRMHRDAAISYLEHLHGLSYCRPIKTPITFEEDNLTVEVISFDFVSQLFSLLSNKDLTGDIDMLDVNPNDPFSKYSPPNGLLGCFNSGTWYHNAWNYLCKDNGDWLCPIIFGCDETLVGSHLGRASVTALNFTLSIFSEELRNRSTSWRTLGFIYDLDIHGETMIDTDFLNPGKGRKLDTDEKKTMIPQNFTSYTFNIHTSPKRGWTKKHQFDSWKT